jgi:hypothetical protein
MADILTTKEIALALDNIIKRAEKYICIFTYNLKIDETYMSRLRNAAKRGVEIIVVFGINNGKSETFKGLLQIPNCKVYFKEYLHAKFFYNEKSLLIGSMNLSEASEKNNYELGVLLTITENPDLFKKVKEEAKEIIDDATILSLDEVGSQQIRSTNIKPTFSQKVVRGTCVRCKKSIEYNPVKPLCPDCYHEWSEWENEYYGESFCHKCGREKDGISYAKPECTSCYKENGSRHIEIQVASGLDHEIKIVLEKHLNVDKSAISIDFDIERSLGIGRDSKQEIIFKELERKFRIKLPTNTRTLKDYWDLYSLVLAKVNRKEK